MAMNSRREKAKKEMRYNDARTRAEKHDKGFEPTAFKVPEGMKVFRFRKAKNYRLDILPYNCTKTSDEPDGNPFCDEAGGHYERTYYTHYIPTPEGGRTYCCLIKTFHERRCPVCDFQNKLRKQGADAKTIDSLDWKEQQLFNVIDLDEKENGVQLFSFNWWQFGKLLDAKVKLKEGKYAGFYHLTNGRTAEIQIEEGTYNNRPTYKPLAIEFEEREDYDTDIMEKVADLDECPIKMSYDELKEILEQGEPSKAESNGEAPKKKSKKSDDDDDPDEKEDDPTADDLGIEKGSKVRHKKFGVCTVVKVSGDGTSLLLKEEDGETHAGCAPSECKLVDDDPDDDEDEDEDEAPAKGKKDSKKSSDEDEDEDDEDPDDEEDEDEDEDSDDDDLDELEEDDEGEKPAKKKGSSKKSSDDEDPDDEEDEDEKPAKKPVKKKAHK